MLLLKDDLLHNLKSVLQKFLCWILNPKYFRTWLCLEIGPLKEGKLRQNKVWLGKGLINATGVVKEKDIGNTVVCRKERSHIRIQWKAALHKPRKVMKRALNFDLELPASKLCEQYHFCCSSHPVWNYLLWQPNKQFRLYIYNQKNGKRQYNLYSSTLAWIIRRWMSLIGCSP